MLKRGPSIDPHGFDAGKLIKGKKRHILVDMQGLLLHAIIHSAGVQDRVSDIWLLATLFGRSDRRASPRWSASRPLPSRPEGPCTGGAGRQGSR